MRTAVIKIRNYDQIIEFNQKASRVSGDVTCLRGRYCIDGKSIQGVLAINPSEPFIIEFPDDAEEFAEFIINFINN